jgi:hypothetical protein
MMSALPLEIEMVIHQQVHEMCMSEVMRELVRRAYPAYPACPWIMLNREEWAEIIQLTCRQRGIRFHRRNMVDHVPGSLIHARHAAHLSLLMAEEAVDAPNDGSEPPLP